MQDIITLIKDVGFPIALIIYVLIRVQPVLTDMRDELTKQTEILRGIKKNGGDK